MLCYVIIFTQICKTRPLILPYTCCFTFLKNPPKKKKKLKNDYINGCIINRLNLRSSSVKNLFLH